MMKNEDDEKRNFRTCDGHFIQILVMTISNLSPHSYISQPLDTQLSESQSILLGLYREDPSTRHSTILVSH